MGRPVGLYARVSSREQKDHGTSLPSQIAAMKAWAEEHGFEPRYEFSEDWTGTQLDRPKLDEIKRLAQAREIEAVLIYSWDRLARDTIHQHVLRYLFEEQWAVKVICVTQPEMDELASMIYQTSMGMAAQIENYLRCERSSRGVREAAVVKGQLPSGGQGLYGFDYKPKSKGGDGKRTINEEEARVVRFIFEWFVEERLTLYGVAKRLEAMGIPSKKGKDRWCYSTLDRLLRNPAYCGKTHAFRWESVEPQDKGASTRIRRSKKSSTRLRPKEEWVELKQSPTPAVISEELWEAAQERLRANRKDTRKPKYPYLLRGMVTCYCGNSMVACSISEKYRYYRCAAKAGVDVAHHFLVLAEPLEEKVWADVQTILTHPEIVFEQLEEEAESGGTVLQERIADIERAIADLQLAERRAVSLYSLGKIDERKIDDEVDRIRTERKAWEEELARLEERLQAKVELAAHRHQLGEMCERIETRLDTLSFAEKREVLQAFGLRVCVREDRSYQCFGALPLVCEVFPTLRSWGG